MTKPLEQWDTLPRAYTFGVPTFYNDFHIGLDVMVSRGKKLLAPKNGTIVNLIHGPAGGNTIWFRPHDEDIIIRFLHLDRYAVKLNERVVEGQVIGYTGNSGLVRPKPTPQNPDAGSHLHLDISKGSVQLSNRANFLDPEEYFKTMSDSFIGTDGEEYVVFSKSAKRLDGDRAIDPKDLDYLMQRHGLGKMPKKITGKPDWDKINAMVKVRIVYK